MVLKWENIYDVNSYEAAAVQNPHIPDWRLCILKRLENEDIGLDTWCLTIWPDGTIKTATSIYYDTKQEALEDAEKALGGWFE